MRIAVVGLRDRDRQHVERKVKGLDKSITVDVYESYGENSKALNTIRTSNRYDYIFVNCRFSNHATSKHINSVADNVINYFGGISKLINIIGDTIN